MKRQIELIRYGAHKSLIKSSSVLIVLLIILQFVNSTTIHEELDDVRRHNDANELTFCQQLRNFESRRARDYKDKGSRVHVRVPRCNRIGDFEPIQCSNEIDNTHCFCVDEYGIEIPGTRAETEDQVNCKKTEDDCPAASCRMFCPSGFARNQTSGCPICKCFDACSDVKCPNGHECEPIEVKCKNEPCPPIPTCRRARSLNDFCPAGSPLSIAGTIRPFLCGNDPGKPQCPPLYKCMVQTGNDYGVCCPASLRYEKPGTCPNSIDFISSPAHGVLCGSSCSHDLECPHVQKCCESAKCGKTCQQPKDSTLCHQAKLQSEILAISRNEGQGYTPQCDTKNGQFKTKQCSNNGLVCWCVNPENGNKIKGTIGAAKTVQCDNIENLLIRSGARSMDGNNQCDQNICAAVCQYGFKTDHNGCNTCECELPCEGFICPVGSKCVVAKDPKCTSGSGLCLSEPICQPDLIYSNPCDQGVPLTHNFTEEIPYCHEELNPSEYQVQTFLDASDENVVGRSLMSKITCPDGFKCTRLKGQSESVCCPNDLIPASADNHEVEETTTTVRQASMCEYLRDFSERMEGTEEGMALAINPPKCNTDGSFVAMQCQLKRMTVTKAEQKKVLEQNNIREMRKLLKNRRRRDVETLKLIRVDNVQQNRRSDDGLDTQVVLDFLKKRIIESPDRFITELFGDNTQGRTARVIDIQAEDYDDEEESDELDARDDRKLALKSQNRFNDLVEVEVEQCYCVDRFGTEIPQTRGSINVTEDTCRQIRDNIDCLDLTCRMGCDYGFVIDPNSKCPTCQCRDPCDGVQCDNNQECRTVEVSCEDAYCPPVPSCFPKKQGQCPFLVPPAGEDSDDACAYECRSDNHCSASKKCCSNGCGTVCVEPMLKSACQHLQSIQIHQAIELGIPAKQKYIAQCNDDGTWKTIQCGPNNICWCVDERGNEKSGTRTSDGIPNCSVSKTSNCPKVRCKYCEHGYVFDENGCKTCECKDLCKEIKCPMDEQCELVQVECINSSAINSTQPCPRLPICIPIRDSVCTEGLPLKQNGRDINCGPDATECPTTHTCNLNPITKHGVCCAKSRDVCFESIDSSCILNDNDVSESIVKYRFNPRYNKCTAIRLSKKNKNSSCASKNLFHNEQACKSVCPVLTQCERLKLKNSIVARRRADKSDIWFRPRCDPETGNWSSVQCIGENTTENTRVCWCADKKGSPIKGSLTKGAEPVCNYRQARRRVQEHTDPVMEELIRQITYLTDESNFLDDDDENSSLEGRSLPSDDKIAIATERALEISEKLSESTKKLIASTTRCDSLRSTARFTVTCDEQGNFQPMQCNHETCWCVDEAGNQIPFSNTFRKGSKNCKHTPLDAIEIELNLINPNNVKLTNLYDIMYEDVRQLIGDENFVNFRVHENSDGTVTLKFDLIDDEKVNQAFAIEEMSKEDNLFLFHGMLKVDMRQSKFSHRIPMEVLTNAQRSSLGIPQNTFHTIVFIIATSSAFIVSILVIYVMLKKGRTKDDKTHYVNNKNLHSGDKFIDYTSPIFVLSANDLPRSHHHPQHHHNSRNNDES